MHKNEYTRMYCPKCGKEIPSGADFCPGCGNRVDSGNSDSRYYQDSQPYTVQPQRPLKKKKDAFLGSFLLGLLLGAIGVIIAVIIYNGDKKNYEEDPTVYALVVSILAGLLWIVLLVILVAFVLATSPTTAII